LLAVLAIGMVAAPVAGAASVSDVRMELGQGKASFHGKGKWKARGFIVFRTSDDGVSCDDMLSLERQVKDPSGGRIQLAWIEIRQAQQRDFGCADRPRARKPVRQRTALNMFHDPAAYASILKKSRMRLVYRVRVLFAGQVVFTKTVIRPVTMRTLGQRYKSEQVHG
jgi:hypothetical protein